MMLEDDGVHPDEGTIHAWLDDALDADASAGVAEHIAGCASCEARVAEARGLIAGATRVVGLLDDQPAPLIKPADTPTAGTDLSVWRLLRVTPARASIAAMLVVAVGIALTRGQLSVDSRHAADQSPATATAAIPAASPAGPRGDSVLNSAIERRLAQEQPPRAISPAAGVAIPTPPPQMAAAPSADFANAESKVLAGRASITSQREAAGARADRTRAGVGQLAVGAADAAERVTVAAKAADNAGTSVLAGRVTRLALGVANGECYRVESGSPASWGSVQLPLIVAMDSAGTEARILTAAGGETEARAYLQHNGADSVFFRLRRIGFSGSMTLAVTGATRTGSIRSSAAGASAPAASSSLKRAAPARMDDGRGAAAIPVTARRVSCPTTD